jgi:hypothetical protein
MRNSNGNGIKACGWGCATYVAIISIVLALAWFRMYGG